MKILFIGPMGAGKTTAIAAVSDYPPISTEADNSDLASHSKATTTVAMDFGEIAMDGGEAVALYGIPGQERFSFMWPVLAEGAVGAILLLDHSAANPAQELESYLDAFPDLVARCALVIGIGHVGGERGGQLLQPYQQVLRQRNLALPLFITDVRERSNVLMLIETLVASAEVSQLFDGSTL